jgi:glycosyltransferase involved in cell wall biosynthesis
VSREKIRTALNLPSSPLLICTVAAIEPLKGLDVLLEALQILLHKHQLNDLLCCHIGGIRLESDENQRYHEELQELVREKQIGDHFVWLGKRNDVSHILNAFDIYVQPSRKEGMGVALMEASASQLPLIGSNVGGIPEIIQHGRNGYLFSPGDAGELAGYIQKLALDREARLAMGAHSRSIVEKDFNQERQTERLVQHYGIL